MTEDELVRIARLEEKVSMWIDNTADYRKQLSKDIEEVKGSNKDIMFAISKLPCDKRMGMYDSMRSQVRFMWAILSAIIMVIISDYIGFKKK